MSADMKKIKLQILIYFICSMMNPNKQEHWADIKNKVPGKNG